MVRMILVSVAVLGLVTFFVFRWQRLVQQAQPPLVTRVDIYPDRLRYRNGFYATPSNLAIGLKASRDPPRLIQVHACEAMPQLAPVLDVIRAEGMTNFEVLLPDDCRSAQQGSDTE
jgi:hypothetical protein